MGRLSDDNVCIILCFLNVFRGCNIISSLIYEQYFPSTGRLATTWLCPVVWRPSRLMGRWWSPVALTSTPTSRCHIVEQQLWMTSPREQRLLLLGGRPWSVSATGKVTEFQTGCEAKKRGNQEGKEGPNRGQEKGLWSGFGQFSKRGPYKRVSVRGENGEGGGHSAPMEIQHQCVSACSSVYSVGLHVGFV